LIAAITILAVLMLIGSQAVMKVIRTTRANSVKKSLDNALKEARIMHINGELPLSAAPSDLSSVLTYDKKDYTFEAFTDNDKIILQKYQPACVFCNNIENIVYFNGKRVCANCVEKLKEQF
ncbi:MAG: hypothetical protein IIX30_00665, partial [Clostridia bacterium]|nr:hypothetical protein [Clostridia bacterium]